MASKPKKVVTVAVACPNCGEAVVVRVTKKTLKEPAPGDYAFEAEAEQFRQGEIFDNRNFKPKLGSTATAEGDGT